MSLPRAEHDENSPESPRGGLAEWIGRHQAYVWRYLRYLGCADDFAEDLAQETFVAALGHGIPDRDEPTAQAWLRTTARNLYRMHLRHQRRQRHRIEEKHLDELDAPFEVHTHPDLGASYAAALDECLASLDGRSRRVLELRYRDGASRREMAAAIGLSTEGVKTLLRRVKDNLRWCIEKRRQT